MPGRVTRFSSLEWKADPSGSFNSYAVSNINFDPNKSVTIENNQYVGNFQSDKNREGGNFTELSFTSELRGFDDATGSFVPEGSLLRACGFGLTSAGSPTVTDHTFALGNLHNVTNSGIHVPVIIGHTVDGFKTWIDNAAGSVTFNFPATQMATMDFTFRGQYRAVASADTAAAFLTGEIPVAVKNYGLSVTPLGSSAITTLRCANISYNVNNEINPRPTIGGTGSFGFGVPQPVSRSPEITALVEMDKGTLTDFETLYRNRTRLLWEFTHNASGSAGNVIDASFSSHIAVYPAYQEDNGLFMVLLTMQQSIDSGATPLTLMFQ